MIFVADLPPNLPQKEKIVNVVLVEAKVNEEVIVNRINANVNRINANPKDVNIVLGEGGAASHSDVSNDYNEIGDVDTVFDIDEKLAYQIANNESVGDIFSYYPVVGTFDKGLYYATSNGKFAKIKTDDYYLDFLGTSDGNLLKDTIVSIPFGDGIEIYDGPNTGDLVSVSNYQIIPNFIDNLFDGIAFVKFDIPDCVHIKVGTKNEGYNNSYEVVSGEKIDLKDFMDDSGKVCIYQLDDSTVSNGGFSFKEIIVGGVSLDDNVVKKTDDIKISPNPVSDFLTIEGLNVGDEYYIYDMNGMEVLGGLYNSGNINISNFEHGVYFMEVNGKKIKFIKE